MRMNLLLGLLQIVFVAVPTGLVWAVLARLNERTGTTWLGTMGVALVVMTLFWLLFEASRGLLGGLLR